MTVSVSGGLLVHGQTTGGLNSGSDWDSARKAIRPSRPTPCSPSIINGGDGNDSITVLAKTTEIFSARSSTATVATTS